MRWQRGRRSENIEDRHGMRVGRGGGVAIGGGTILLIALVTMLLGGDPIQVLEGLEQAQLPMESDVEQYGAPSPEESEQADFVSVVLADTEDTWPRQSTVKTFMSTWYSRKLPTSTRPRSTA